LVDGADEWRGCDRDSGSDVVLGCAGEVAFSFKALVYEQGKAVD